MSSPLQKIRFCPHCGCVLTKPRSPKHHRHFFAIIDRAFANWPENHRHQPDNPEHLRAWLLVQAGHRDVIHDNPDHPSAEFITAIVSRVRETGYAFPAVHCGALAVAFPRSINWETLDQKDFNPIAESVYAVIEDVLQVSIKELQANAGTGSA